MSYFILMSWHVGGVVERRREKYATTPGGEHSWERASRDAMRHEELVRHAIRGNNDGEA